MKRIIILGIICIIFGLAVFSSCSDPIGVNNSTSLDRKSIIGTYQSEDGSNIISINESFFSYNRTYPGKEGNFVFKIDEDSDWKIFNHQLKFNCYMVMVEGKMEDFDVKQENSPNSNIKDDAKNLTFIVRMEWVNGKQTGKVTELLLPTNDVYVELVYRKN